MRIGECIHPVPIRVYVLFFKPLRSPVLQTTLISEWLSCERTFKAAHLSCYMLYHCLGKCVSSHLAEAWLGFMLCVSKQALVSFKLL